MIQGPRRRLPRVLVSLGGALAALLLLEGIGRLRGPAVCPDTPGPLLHAAEDVGWTFTPNLSFHLVDCAGSGWGAPVSINSDGLADQEWPREKRPGRVRALLLGGQLVDGLGVAREDRLSVRLSYLADATRGAAVSVVNASIPGYATAEQLRWLQERGRPYAPDVVVLVIDPSHDLAANLHPSADRLRPVEPNFAPSSGLLALGWPAREQAPTLASASPGPVEVEPPPPLQSTDAERALSTTRALVRRIADASRDLGASFAVLIAPPCPPETPPVELCPALDEIAPCIDPTPTFDGLRASTERPLELCRNGLGRWGRDGHFLASHALWDLLDRADVWPEGVVRGHRL